MRRHVLAFYPLLGFLTLCLVAVGAQDARAGAAPFPTKSITLICPFPTGGTIDGNARAVAEAVRKHLPRPVAVVNRPGGAGSIGATEVMQAKPDGYTIGVTGVSSLAIAPHLTDLPYNGPEEFAHILGLTAVPNAFAVNSNSPYKGLREFLEASKANPGKFKVATSAKGTNVHLAANWLNMVTNAGFVVAPYTGGGEPIAALLGGHVDATMESTATVQPMTQAGKMRILAIFEPQRISSVPDAPTAKELNIPVEYNSYYSLFAPKGTPEAVLTILHDAFLKATKEKLFLTFMHNTLAEPMPLDGKGMLAKLKADHELYGKLAEQVGLKKK
jgi:tripartite-type tricarboxylate transporter receptor subunit TctC